MPLQQWWLALKLVNSQGFSGLEQCLWQLEQALWSTSAFFFPVEISPEEWIQRCISSNYGNMCMSIYTVHGAVWNWPWTKKRWLKSRENPNYCCRFSARVRSTAIKLCHFNIYHYCFKPPCIIPHVVQDVHNSTTNVLCFVLFFFTICQGQFPNRGKLIHAFIQGEQTSVLL